MKKVIVIAIMLMMSVTVLQARSYTDYYPNGKNYLDSNNFQYGNDYLETIDPFTVKANQTYTLTMPRDIDHLYVEVYGAEYFLEGETYQLSECTEDIDKTYCNFTTSPTTSELSIYIAGGYLSDYLNSNGMYLFQLEEGNISTAYEAYMPPSDITAPSMSGRGTYITTYRNETAIEDIVTTHISAHDEKDGDVSETIEIVEDNYTSNKNTVGEYSVIIEAHDTHNNTSQFELQVLVKDEFSPVFSGTLDFISDVDMPRSLDSILTEVTATDEYDGIVDITVVEENYSESMYTVGTYSATLSASDQAGNVEVVPVSIEVVDTVAPVMTSALEVSSSISNPKTALSIVNNSTVVDNYDLESDITKEIVRDTYTSHSNQKGEYEIDVLIRDQSDNQDIVTIKVDVLDDIAPLITGPNNIVLSYRNILSTEDIKELFILSDNETSFDYDDFIIVSDNYSSNRDQLGDYVIRLELTDESSNTSSVVLNVSVIDDIGPVLTTDDYIVSVSSDTVVSNDDLINILLTHDQIEDQDYEVSVVKDEYTKNLHVPGSYKYSIKLTDSSGDSTQKDFLIVVEDNVIEEESHFIETVLFRNILFSSIALTAVIVTFIRVKKK